MWSTAAAGPGRRKNKTVLDTQKDSGKENVWHVGARKSLKRNLHIKQAL